MKNLIFFLVAISLIGCVSTSMSSSNSPKYVIEVDSYGEDSTLVGKSCFLFLADSTINKTDLQFSEFHDLLLKFFIQKKYNIVDSFGLADVIILYNYGISDPTSKEISLNLPVWGQTGISSTSTSGDLKVDPYSNNIKYSEKTTRTPSYGITGYNNVQTTLTSYLRYLNLVAFDMDHYKKTKEQKRLWQSYITSSGSSGDLRKTFPIMLIGASNYIGHKSGEKIQITIHEDDPDVLKLKGK